MTTIMMLSACSVSGETKTAETADIADAVTSDVIREKKGKVTTAVFYNGIKLKNKDFKSMTHQVKLKNATNSMSVIFETAKKLTDEMWKDEAIRLVGLGVDNLTSKSVYQTSLFDEDNVVEIKALETTLDKIKNKYGYNIIGKASLKGKKRIKKKY